MDNSFGTYREIRAQRTWRPLGRMSWWRIILGIALLILVVLLSGVLPQRLAAEGRFREADRLLLFPAWMERYKPDSRTFIEAGLLYENGSPDAASALLKTVNPSGLSEGEAQAYENLMKALEDESPEPGAQESESPESTRA